MTKPEPLQHNQYYHIYNRGNSGENLFREDRNYLYFLNLYTKYIEPIAETQTGPVSETGPVFHKPPSRQFNNLFIAYAKAINKAYGRTGVLFERPFKRKLITDDRYFTALVAYIHRNPQEHGLVPDFRDWPHSSYWAMLSDKPTRLQREAVLEWFGGRVGFGEFHADDVDEGAIGALSVEDSV